MRCRLRWLIGTTVRPSALIEDWEHLSAPDIFIDILVLKLISFLIQTKITS